MKGVKGIDELYEEVRDYDLVITNDAALATALNGRIDKPIIGPFALTPKQIASQVASRVMNSPLYSELMVISTVSAETGLSIKYVHSEIENIKEIRKYTKDVRKYLHSASAKEVYDSYEAIPTLERLMGSFIPEDDEFYEGNCVAVIEEDLFNDLDKHFIPIKHDSISIFKKEVYDIDTIYEIGNDRQLAENTVDMIDPSRPGDFAIVLNTSSPITDAVRAALYRKGLPFINSLAVRDLSQIRDYLQFITLALDFDTIRVKHVKELFSNYNGFFKKGREEFLLSKQTDADMRNRGRELWEVMKNIRNMTYSEVCETICDRRAKIQVGILINDLQVADTKITSVNLNEVKYAVDNVNELHHNEEIPEEEKKGVLLVDCNNSVYIDRPVVFFLGMEQDWNKTLIGKQYIDIEDETDKNVARLNALMQQGQIRYYFVNSTKGGKPARPCMMFDLLYKKPMDSFSLMCAKLVKGRWHSEEEQKLPDDPSRGISNDSVFDVKFSKSSFNNYYSCPRRFMYGLFLSTPEEKNTEFGTLIHSFAEFYVCYPDDVTNLGLDHFVDLISDRYSGLSSPLLETLDRAKIKQAMWTVTKYIDHLGIKDVPLDVPLSEKKNPNKFMIALGKEYTSSLCERDLESVKYPVHGQLDLFWNGVITDYKTGKPGDVKGIAESMTPNSKSKYPEFQAPIYLCLSLEHGGYRSEFDLFYAMDNDVTSIVDGIPITSNVRYIKLSDKTIKQTIVESGEFRAFLGSVLSKNLRSNVDAILRVIRDMASEDVTSWDQDLALINNIADSLGMNRTKTNSETISKGLRKIAGFAENGILRYNDTIEMTSGFMESVMDFISQMHHNMSIQSKKEFPANPRGKCTDCPYFSVCTKEILDAGGESNE